jgi:hypothetical protein
MRLVSSDPTRTLLGLALHQDQDLVPLLHFHRLLVQMPAWRLAALLSISPAFISIFDIIFQLLTRLSIVIFPLLASSPLASSADAASPVLIATTLWLLIAAFLSRQPRSLQVFAFRPPPPELLPQPPSYAPIPFPST